jgi:hypothetical protein
MTRTLTGTIYKPDGTAWAGGVVTIELLEGFTTSTEVYPPTSHAETLDSNGQFSTALGVPDTGTAHYKITKPNGSWF